MMGEPASRPSLGLLLPTRGLLLKDDRPSNAERVLSLARTAEDAGIDSLWVGDSLTAKPRLEPLTTLAAVAARTQRVRIGTAVLLPALRHPVTAAHVIGTLDLLSEGRLVVGCGVGGAFNDALRKEWLTVGVDPRERAGRLEEWVQVVKRLTRGETVTFAGRHFSLDAVAVQPASPQSGGVPLLLATHWKTGNERQHRRAVRYADGYIGISDSPEDFAKLTSRLRGLAGEEGRAFDAMDSAFYMTVNLDADEKKAEREADAFIRRYYGQNFWKEKWGPFGHPNRVASRIREYGEAGARTVVVRFASLEQEAQLGVFLERVLPNVR
jgi:alkanesulfonate monooxygenase SsuD/methylene tetrahydromethanopterin reductase-like flavin-dependent oxidoreductase (luciferase family)